MSKRELRRRGPACPICQSPIGQSPTGQRYRPFCSRRCADIDLGRWLNGSYAIPGHPDAEEDGSAEFEAIETGQNNFLDGSGN